MTTKGNYRFLNETFENEQDFALALSQNYADALNYIFTNEFKSCFLDSYLRGRVDAEIKRCKYAESALTMIIYLLNPSLGLCVRGKYFKTLKDLARFMYNTSLDKQKSIIHLFKDHCITHTLGLKEKLDDKLKNDIVYVEDHIEDDSIYEYFVSLFDIKFKQEDAHGLSVFDYFIYGVTNEKDRFQAYLNLLNDPSFKSSLYKVYSIPEILKIYNQKDAPFAILKLLGENVSIDMAPIVDSGINVWLCKNVDNYKFARKAKHIKRLLVKCNNYIQKLSSIEEKIEFNEKIYNIYKSFINFYDCNLITAKSEEYEFKYYYNGSRGTKAYYNSINIVISDEYLIEQPVYSKANKKKIIHHTNVELKKYLDKEFEQNKENDNVPTRQIKRLSSYRFFAIFSLIVSLLSAVGISLLAIYNIIEFTDLYSLIMLSVAGFALLFSIFTINLFSKKINVIRENFLGNDEQYLLQKAEKTVVYKKGYKRTLLAVLINDILYSTLLAAFTYFLLIYNNRPIPIQYFEYYILSIPAVYLLLNIINRKYKSINLLLLIAVVITVLLIMMLI